MQVVQALTLPLPRLAMNKIGNRVGIDNNFNPTAWLHPAQMAGIRGNRSVGFHYSEDHEG